MPTHPRRYAVAILGDHAEVAQLVAWCEPNPGRVDYYDEVVTASGGQPLPRYAPADLEAMISEQDVEAVVVTSPDYTHAEMVSRALLAGADVVVEKPLTINAEGCRTINDAIEKSGKNVVMTFNYRYSPRNSVLREVIASGRIGEVTAVHFEWALDTVHGADYFRRWHREKDKSGGLLIHKSSHHFDLVNWWLADVPRRVYASGDLRFYGDAGAGAAQQTEPRPARGAHFHSARERRADAADAVVVAGVAGTAITAASVGLGSKYLNECKLYVTLEPCVMCAGASYWAKLQEIHFGAEDPRRGIGKIS